MAVADRTGRADPVIGAARIDPSPAVRRGLERWITDHPTLDVSADRFGWVGRLGDGASAVAGRATGEHTVGPRWVSVAVSPDLDLTRADDPADHPANNAYNENAHDENADNEPGFDVLHAVDDVSTEPGLARSNRIARRWRSVKPDRFLALSVPADGPGGDPSRLNRDLLDGTHGRVALEHLEVVTDPDPATGPWLTVVVRRLR